MWFEHFKCLGIPSTQSHYDTMLCDLVTNTVVQKIASDFSNPSNQFDLNSPIEESEVVSVCQGLASGTAGGICQTTYEHLKCLKWLFLNVWRSLQKTKTISLISSSVLKTELGVSRPRF